MKSLGGRIPLILDGGPTAVGIESTVIDCSVEPCRILRPGVTGLKEIEALIGPVGEVVHSKETGIPHPSPGMSALHYAPRTPLECVPDGEKRCLELAAAKGIRLGLVMIASEDKVNPSLPDCVMVVVLPDNPREYASRLFSTLHQLDDAGLEKIVVTMPPDRGEWAGVRDRLGRAVH